MIHVSDNIQKAREVLQKQGVYITDVEVALDDSGMWAGIKIDRMPELFFFKLLKYLRKEPVMAVKKVAKTKKTKTTKRK